MTVRKTRDLITPSLKRNMQQFDRVAQAAYRYWVSITPRDTGRARRRTQFRQNSILARYPYAEPLDSGSSGQAPEGMSKPTGRFIRRWLRRNIRK